MKLIIPSVLLYLKLYDENDTECVDPADKLSLSLNRYEQIELIL